MIGCHCCCCAARLLVPHELTHLAQILIRDEDGRVAQEALRLHDTEHAFAVAALLLLRGGINHELKFDEKEAIKAEIRPEDFTNER